MSQASFNDNATSVVKAIQDGVETAVINIDDVEYTTRPVFLPPSKANVAALQISTLDGLVEYLKSNADNHNFSDLLIVVESPDSVTVFGQVGGATDARVKWLECDFELDGFPFERFIDHETFMVKAQALLCPTDDREDLLRFVGNLTTATVSNSTDNGTSQTVIVETGVRKSEVELPNPVLLAPFRTFSEIEQPNSPFVLRVKQAREGLMPELALFEADGGLWKIDAIKFIKDYLKKNLGDDITAKIPVIG